MSEVTDKVLDMLQNATDEISRLRAEKEELRSRNARSENEIERLRSLVHDAANYLLKNEYPSEENSDE